MDNTTFNGKGLHFMHLNIRSLFNKNKFDMFKQQMSQSNIDVLCLSETWLKRALPSNIINISGYTVTRLDRSWEENGHIKKGGGICMYIKNNLNFSDNSFCELNLSTINIEIHWISIKLTNLREIVIGNVYRPPQGDLKTFYRHINLCLDKLTSKNNRDIFMMGDFNINIDKASNKESKDLINLFNSFGLKQLIRETTRYGAKNSCIDLIFTNSDYISKSGTLDLNFSDHQAVYVTRKKNKIINKKITFKGRSYKNYNKDLFQDRLMEENWRSFFESDNPNKCWDILENKILLHLENMCPLKEFKINEYREAWMNRDLMELIIDKDKAMAHAKKSKKEDDFRIARNMRNTVGNLIFQSKKNHFEDEYNASKKDPKKFWNNIFTILPKNKEQKLSINLKNDLKEEINSEETASYINDFFANIGPNLAKVHNKPWKYYGNESLNTIANLKINAGNVNLLVDEIDITKSSGIDYISSKCLKDALAILIPHLCHIFKLSIEFGLFPKKWKIATIVPLYKGGGNDEVSNYRPVSLLPIPGKILEKLIHNHMMEYFENNKILSEYQFGFRKNHSTIDSIATLTDNILKSVNEGKVTLAAFIDFKKAFDTVNHNILLEKLYYLGIKGSLLTWIKNYLTNRVQRTICNGKLSGLNDIICGVPQGSILGPLFFLVYVNDLKNVLRNNNYQLYADDTVIYCSSTSFDRANIALQDILNKFGVWCSENALTVNVKKTKVMAFGSKNNIKKDKGKNLMLNDEKISFVPTFKFLGVYLDQTLNFRHHMDMLVNNINFKLYLLSKIRKYLNNKSALTIYKSMILPYFDYADVVYMYSNNPDLAKLDRAHLRGLRISLKIQGKMDDIEIFNLGTISSLKNRRIVHSRNFMYKNKEKCVIKNDGIITRANEGPLFNIVKPNCESVKRSVYYGGASDWNNLDSSIRNLENIFLFKRKQKSWLLNTYKI